MGTHPSFSAAGPSSTYQPKTTDESDLSIVGTVVPSVNAQALDLRATVQITATDSVVAAPNGAGGLSNGASTAGSVAAIQTNGADSSWMVMVTGLTTGTLYFEGSPDSTTGYDGNWIGINGRDTGVVGGSIIANNVSSNTIFRGNVSGFKWFRVRAVGTLSGSPFITLCISDGTGPVFLNSAIPAGANIIGKVGLDLTSLGTVGHDYSANTPTLPVIGQPFAASGPYASYVLVATVPASSTRANADIENASGAQIVILRDDGTAASGSVPANASLIPLGGGSAAGAQGGSWTSTTFKGRLQVYAPVSTAQVSVFVD